MGTSTLTRPIDEIGLTSDDTNDPGGDNTFDDLYFDVGPSDVWTRDFTRTTTGFGTDGEHTTRRTFRGSFVDDATIADFFADDGGREDDYDIINQIEVMLVAGLLSMFASRFAPPPVYGTTALLFIVDEPSITFGPSRSTNGGPCTRCNGDISRCPLRGLIR